MKTKLPIFRAIVGEGKLEYVSLVDKPAIIEKGLAFKTDKVMGAYVRSKMEEFKFSKADKQVIVGPAMIPDFPILRVDEEIGEYVIVFDKESIAYFQEQFSGYNKEYKVNFDHLSESENGIVKEAFIKSNWLIEDEQFDKSRMYGFEYPVGTWMMEVKVKDTAFWNKMVKEEGRFGFSVEGLFQLEMTGDFIEKNKVINMKQEISLEQIMAKLAELTPEEVAAIKDAVSSVVEDEVVVDEIVKEVVDEVTDLMNEGVAEGEVDVELQDELPVEPASEPLTEEKVMELVKPMFDEIYKLIAELKKEHSDAGIDEEVEEELGYKDKEEKMQRLLTGFRNLQMAGINFN